MHAVYSCGLAVLVRPMSEAAVLMMIRRSMIPMGLLRHIPVLFTESNRPSH